MPGAHIPGRVPTVGPALGTLPGAVRSTQHFPAGVPATGTPGTLPGVAVPTPLATPARCSSPRAAWEAHEATLLRGQQAAAAAACSFAPLPPPAGFQAYQQLPFPVRYAVEYLLRLRKAHVSAVPQGVLQRLAAAVVSSEQAILAALAAAAAGPGGGSSSTAQAREAWGLVCSSGMVEVCEQTGRVTWRQAAPVQAPYPHIQAPYPHIQVSLELSEVPASLDLGTQALEATLELEAHLLASPEGSYLTRHPLLGRQQRLLALELTECGGGGRGFGAAEGDGGGRRSTPGAEVVRREVVRRLVVNGLRLFGRQYIYVAAKERTLWFVAGRSVAHGDALPPLDHPKQAWALLGAVEQLPVPKLFVRSELWVSKTQSVALQGWAVRYEADVVNGQGVEMTDGCGRAHPDLWGAIPSLAAGSSGGGAQRSCAPMQMRLYHRLLPGRPRVMSKGVLMPDATLPPRTIVLRHSQVKAPALEKVVKACEEVGAWRLAAELHPQGPGSQQQQRWQAQAYGPSLDPRGLSSPSWASCSTSPGAGAGSSSSEFASGSGQAPAWQQQQPHHCPATYSDGNSCASPATAPAYASAGAPWLGSGGFGGSGVPGGGLSGGAGPYPASEGCWGAACGGGDAHDYEADVVLELCHAGMDVKRCSRLNGNLLPLLERGGVPRQFFARLLEAQLQDARECCATPPAALDTARAMAPRFGDLTSRLLARWGEAEGDRERWGVRDLHLLKSLHDLASSRLEQLRKMQLQVQDSYIAMGVPDHHGLLQPGQVVLLSKGGTVEQPGRRALLYRDPGLHPGDVRVVELVDRPPGFADKYGAMCNCVLMPTQGRQPLAALCANGDYDGDTYHVITCPEIVAHFTPWTRSTCLDAPPPWPAAASRGGAAPAASSAGASAGWGGGGAAPAADSSSGGGNGADESSSGGQEKLAALADFWVHNQRMGEAMGATHSAWQCYMDKYGCGSDWCLVLEKAYRDALDAKKHQTVPTVPYDPCKPQWPRWAADKQLRQRKGRAQAPAASQQGRLSVMAELHAMIGPPEPLRATLESLDVDRELVWQARQLMLDAGGGDENSWNLLRGHMQKIYDDHWSAPWSQWMQRMQAKGGGGGGSRDARKQRQAVEDSHSERVAMTCRIALKHRADDLKRRWHEHQQRAGGPARGGGGGACPLVSTLDLRADVVCAAALYDSVYEKRRIELAQASSCATLPSVQGVWRVAGDMLNHAKALLVAHAGNCASGGLRHEYAQTLAPQQQQRRRPQAGGGRQAGRAGAAAPLRPLAAEVDPNCRSSYCLQQQEQQQQQWVIEWSYGDDWL